MENRERGGVQWREFDFLRVSFVDELGIRPLDYEENGGTAGCRMNRIPVIDLFAGPGGLGEGFSRAGFDVRLSIEMNPVARKTLRLRALSRELRRRRKGEKVKAWLKKASKGSADLSEIEGIDDEATRFADEEAWETELGVTPHAEVHERIKNALDGAESWVLLGGPPCQAYSLVGRSRMRSVRDDFDEDKRHFLYKEYLQIVADFSPPVFLMENVKGILSSTVKGKRIFNRILEDLAAPGQAVPGGAQGLTYNLRPLICPEDIDLLDVAADPARFLVKAEEYGIPQKRHRVFVLGVRSDLDLEFGELKSDCGSVTVDDVIRDLSPTRSDLSRRDGGGNWSRALYEILEEDWFRELAEDDENNGPAIANLMRDAIFNSEKKIGLVRRKKQLSIGSGPSGAILKWCGAGKFPELNHEARSHMRTDLHRYLFAASFAETNGYSPKLGMFPEELLPNHKNAKGKNGKTAFEDRFRVQCSELPGTTVTCHISKDGHYFIHPDPAQCRSLTVREAARIQTFPDDYFFCGPRTEQYRQVGNAVPPYLAFKIAKIIKASLA